MEALPHDPFGLSLSGGKNYRSPMMVGGRRQCILYPYHHHHHHSTTTTTTTTGSSGGSNSSIISKVKSSATSEDGDYQVTSYELISSPHNSYEVLEILGRGTFGQVLKCWKRESGEVLALKILKNLPSYSKQGQVEVEILTTLSRIDSEQFNFVHAYESFIHQGHICIAFELLQINLYDYLKKNRFQPLPLEHIRPVAQQVLTCLKKLKELGLVHADLKPENIMLVDPERQPFRVKVIDFGSATRPSVSLSTTYLQSRYYRAPEVILGVSYDESIDMWSLGCVLAEMFLGWPLFPGATEYDQIMYIMQMLGPPPTHLTKNSAKMRHFFRKDNSNSKWLLKLETGVCSKETRKFIFKSVAAIGQMSSSSSPGHDVSRENDIPQLIDRIQFISLLELLMTFDPQKRADPITCLQHPFISMLHLAQHTTSPCVRDWIQCMQICCHSRITSSSSSSSTIHHHSSPHIQPYSPLPSLTYNLNSSFLPSHHHLSNSVDYLISPHPTPSLMVDTGYVSAESSPTTHTILDYPKIEFYQPSSTLPHACCIYPQHPTYWFMLHQAAGYSVNHSRL